jgi:hypothetical protein
MTDRELGQHRDAHLEMERLLRKSGPILESAVQMGIKIHGPMFTQTGPDLRHRLTGVTIEDFVASRRKSNPNDYADWTPDDPNQLMHVYESEAFGEMCSPKTVGRLYTYMKDPARFEALAKAWGCDTVRMLPGKRPGSAPATSGTKSDDDESSKNPWNVKTWRGGEERRQEKIQSILKTSTEMARKFAASAGVRIDGGPLLR